MMRIRRLLFLLCLLFFLPFFYIYISAIYKSRQNLYRIENEIRTFKKNVYTKNLFDISYLTNDTVGGVIVQKENLVFSWETRFPYSTIFFSKNDTVSNIFIGYLVENYWGVYYLEEKQILYQNEVGDEIYVVETFNLDTIVSINIDIYYGKIKTRARITKSTMDTLLYYWYKLDSFPTINQEILLELDSCNRIHNNLPIM